MQFGRIAPLSPRWRGLEPPLRDLERNPGRGVRQWGKVDKEINVYSSCEKMCLSWIEALMAYSASTATVLQSRNRSINLNLLLFTTRDLAQETRNNGIH